MSVSVISSPPKGANNAAAQLNSAPTTPLQGDFAALLSGELLNFQRLIPGLAAKTLATETMDKEPKFASEQLASDATSQIDPSILAALNGNPVLQPEIANRGNLSLPAETKKPEELNAHNVDLDIKSGNPEQKGLKTSSPENFGAAERFALATPRQGESIALGNETANFAAETKVLDINTAPLISSPGSSLGAKSTAESPPPEPSNISTHLRDSRWSQQFGEKIVWLTKSDQQSAQININPPELGPVQITLNLNGDQAKMVFASPHPEVRQAIENALPQLKEMLSAAGISLGQTNVGANMAQQNPDNPYQSGNGKRSTDENVILPASDKAPSIGASLVLQRGRGLVDLFA